MERRDLLRAGATLGVAGLAGCTGMFETRSANAPPPVVEDRPEAVYVPTHVEGMEMVGMGVSGRFKLGLMYSYPHRFWTISGRETNRVSIGSDDDAHLMATIWDSETMTVLPTANVSMAVSKDDEVVGSRSLWPMLSQNMGYHFGDNFSLDGDGTYRAEISVGAMQTRGLGDLQGALDERTELEVEFDYSEEAKNEIVFEELPDRQGEEGAVDPMEMDMAPISRVPEKPDLPGEVVGEAASGDAEFLVAAPDEAPEFVADGETYLVVSPRTPYNRFPLPFMGVSATLTRDGESVFDGALDPAVGPDLGYHYGAAVEGVESGDELTVVPEPPPQVSRHEGYETAFVEMPEMELTV